MKELILKLAAALDRGGKYSEAYRLRNMFGDAEGGGIARIVEDWLAENRDAIDNRDLSIPVKLTGLTVSEEPPEPGSEEEPARVVRAVASTDFGDGRGGQIVRDILLVGVITALLGIGD